METIGGLKFQGGTSQLQMVTFDIAGEDAVYPVLLHRFRLLTEGQNPVDFEFNDDQWHLVTTFADDEDWIHALNDLVTRGSERAVFEVRDRLLKAYSPDAVRYEESQWLNTWRRQRPRSVEELFLARFQPMNQQDTEALHADGDRMLNLRLPCGHGTFVRRIHIVALSGKSCLKQQCLQCGRRIMQREDREQLKVRQEWDAVESHRTTYQHWRQLERQVPKSSLEYRFDSGSLLRALNASLKSFNMPRSVCPPSLCPTTFQETKLVQVAFEQHSPILS